MEKSVQHHSKQLQLDNTMKESRYLSIIRAVVTDPTVPGRLALREVEYLNVAHSEALVRVGVISLNRSEVRCALTTEASWRPGWDFAGVVEQAALDDSGSKQGARNGRIYYQALW